MDEVFETKLETMESCPICRSHDLRLQLWSGDEGEIEAVECKECECTAPVTSWNNGRDRSIESSGTGAIRSALWTS